MSCTNRRDHVRSSKQRRECARASLINGIDELDGKQSRDQQEVNTDSKRFCVQISMDRTRKGFEAQNNDLAVHIVRQHMGNQDEWFCETGQQMSKTYKGR